MEPDQTNPFGLLAAALAKAQSKIVPPKKTRVVDFTFNGKRTNYKYADLADVLECIKIPLSENGLALFHQIGKSPEGFGMSTTLVHTSGESISTWYPLEDPSKGRPQEFGAVLTYARRYSISALVGVASEEDTDGHSSTTDSQSAKPNPTLVNPHKEPKAFTELRAKNAAVDDLDAHLNAHPMSPRDIALVELTEFVEGTGIPHEDVRTAIKLVTGSMVRTSRDLNETELKIVLKKLKNG